jgi:hypothetical protein
MALPTVFIVFHTALNAGTKTVLAKSATILNESFTLWIICLPFVFQNALNCEIAVLMPLSDVGHYRQYYRFCSFKHFRQNEDPKEFLPENKLEKVVFKPLANPLINPTILINTLSTATACSGLKPNLVNSG